VDGGVVRNFPVRDVKDMGADYTIGVNLSSGLLKADKLNSAIDIYTRLLFTKMLMTFSMSASFVIF